LYGLPETWAIFITENDVMRKELLMHDFSCTDKADMYYGTPADRVRAFNFRTFSWGSQTAESW